MHRAHREEKTFINFNYRDKAERTEKRYFLLLRARTLREFSNRNTEICTEVTREKHFFVAKRKSGDPRQERAGMTLLL